MHTESVRKTCSSTTLTRANVSTIFGRAAELISEAKQTEPCLWPAQRPLCEQPRATSVAANAEFKATETKG